MELEKVTAEIRPRTQWEAIDLGLRLTGEHSIALLKGWMTSVFPMGLLILGICHQSVGWGIFLIWWLKPIWECVALHPLSRSLFGEHSTWRENMKVLPDEVFKNKGLVLIGVILTALGWFLHSDSGDEANSKAGFVFLYWCVVFGLLFYRSSFSRSLVLPIRYLESLGGARYKARYQTLSYRSASSAIGLTCICLLMELLLCGSQVYFAFLMLPDGVEISEFLTWDAFLEGESKFLPNWIWVVLGVCYLNAVSIVAWFYTGAGFGLYVNTRTWAEGWDIELKFKGLGQRLGLILLGLVMLGSSARVEANQDAQRVLNQEDFKVDTRAVYEDEEKEESSDSNSKAGDGVFAGIGQFLFWIIVIAAIVGLIWVVIHNLHVFRGRPKDAAGELKKVTTVAGLNVEPENLPSDLLVKARKMWEGGQYQAALGLLYRGAISSLVTRQLVEIEESDTEMDCLRRVVSRGEIASASYFALLTNAWISQAYARRCPNERIIDKLWKEWPFQEGGQK
ncbi:hypothetical protein N8587_01020 [Akkermansiaceae bacterium]|nr:hypothetical protein [Akkermansiaceae bacterium]MDA8958640.1 hypothetical protein [bacterium]MDA7873131.1 hypothetical protein [Akkermansiaceae bacterium]MDA7895168.1 hypothetical protein [Akkermansiaceae bacterium]MDA7911513.1 hypothetical protein [Akkermansiaceae bacterium]